MSARKIDRKKVIYSLALKITSLMYGLSDRLEAIDACDIARILFRKNSKTAQSHPEVRRESV